MAMYGLKPGTEALYRAIAEETVFGTSAAAQSLAVRLARRLSVAGFAIVAVEADPPVIQTSGLEGL